MPYWVYGYNYEVMNLLPGDMFQAFDSVYTVDDDWQSVFDTAMASHAEAETYADATFSKILYKCDWTYWDDESGFMACLAGYGADSFSMSRTLPLYSDSDYSLMDIDWFDSDEMLDTLYADSDIWYVFYDGDDIDGQWWLDYDIYYNWDQDKLFMLLDATSSDLTTGGAADPSDEANFATDEFLAVWEEIEMTDNTMLMFVYQYEEFYATLDCYDWATTTADTFYGSFTFEYGTWCCHEGRVYDCWADDCQTVQPDTDDAEFSWYLTSYEPNPYDEAAMLDLVIPIIECFEYPGDYFPYMTGDVVCDPYYPEFVAW